MRPFLLCVALGLLGLAPAPALGRAPIPSPIQSLEPAFDVRVNRGRASLVEDGGLRTVTSHEGSVRGRGDAALGLGTAGKAEVTWRSRASLRLSGPAEIEWTNLELTDELQLIVGSAAGFELEARRTGVRVELSQGWGLQAGEAALQLEETPNGGWIIKHHGGEPVRVRSRIPRKDAEWPRVIRAGDEVRLAPRRTHGR